MKTICPFIFAFGFSGLGMYLANEVFGDVLFPKTILQFLKSQGEPLLDPAKDDEKGLVLAQKYREHGVSRENRENNYSKDQKDPGFLSSELGNRYKGNSWNDFSNDEELAKELRKACREAFEKTHEEELHKKTLLGCQLKLPKVVERLLKKQKDLNCRFFLKFEDKKDKKFVWEELDKVNGNDIYSYLSELERNLNNDTIINYFSFFKNKQQLQQQKKSCESGILNFSYEIAIPGYFYRYGKQNS